MICKKCKSSNVNVQIFNNTKSNGGHIPFWYWISFAWVIDLMLYCCVIGFFGINIHHNFKKTKTKAESRCVCQDCGYVWKA